MSAVSGVKAGDPGTHQSVTSVRRQLTRSGITPMLAMCSRTSLDADMLNTAWLAWTRIASGCCDWRRPTIRSNTPSGKLRGQRRREEPEVSQCSSSRLNIRVEHSITRRRESMTVFRSEDLRSRAAEARSAMKHKPLYHCRVQISISNSVLSCKYLTCVLYIPGTVYLYPIQ